MTLRRSISVFLASFIFLTSLTLPVSAQNTDDLFDRLRKKRIDFQEEMAKAKDGDWNAEEEICRYYFERGSFDESWPWCIKSAKRGNSFSQVYVAMHFDEGRHMDVKESYKWALISEVGANVTRRIVKHAEKVLTDKEKAEVHFLLARLQQEKPEPPVPEEQFVKYRDSNSRMANFKAFRHFKVAAELGDYPAALLPVARAYGSGIKRHRIDNASGKIVEDILLEASQGEARRWYERAVRAGISSARLEYATYIYRHLERNTFHAVEIYNLFLRTMEDENADPQDRRYAEASLPFAYYLMGKARVDEGCCNDEAMFWLLKGAEGGMFESMFELILMHLDDRNPTVPPEEVYKWYLIHQMRLPSGEYDLTEQLTDGLSEAQQNAAKVKAVDWYNEFQTKRR